MRGEEEQGNARALGHQVHDVTVPPPPSVAPFPGSALPLEREAQLYLGRGRVRKGKVG